MARKISRRTLLKGAAATAGLAAFSPPLFVSSPQVAKAATPLVKPDEVVYSWCRQCVLPPCGIKVEVKDGVIAELQGNPESPTNRGALCARGNATPLAVYNPYRVKKPLKRTNPKKGFDQDPGWQEITWEEAFATVTEKLKAVRAKDPRRFLLCNGFARAGSMLEGMEFCAAFGTPNYLEVDGPTCSVHFGAAFLQGNFTGPRLDPAHTNYCILMGVGQNASAGYVDKGTEFANAVARGMKVVVIDPVNKIEASKGEWIPIRPGTDLAFLLAMQHGIVHELKTMDVHFLKRRTNGPYLVGPDKHYVRDPGSGKPLVWDAKAGAAKAFDDPSVEDFALDGKYEVNGVSCEPGFQIYVRSLLPYTPEWAAQITGINAATIRRVMREFVEAAQIGSTVNVSGVNLPLRPAVLELGRGAITQFYGGNAHCSGVILQMLVGALDIPGGGQSGVGPSHKCTPVNRALAPNADGIVAPKLEAAKHHHAFLLQGVENDPHAFIWPPHQVEMKTFFPYTHDNPHLAFDVILDPAKYSMEYTPEVMLIWAGNPLLRVYNPNKVAEALKKMDFIFTISYSLDEPAMFADIVLPESCGLERYSFATRPGTTNTPNGPMRAIAAITAHKVIEPVYDSMMIEEIYIELADRLGILYGPDGLNAKLGTNKYSPVVFGGNFVPATDKRYTAKEIANMLLKVAAGPEAEIDALRNQAKPPARLLPLISAYPGAAFPVGKTRYAIYLEQLLANGEELVGNLKRVNATIPGWTFEELMQFYQPTIQWMEKRRKIPAEYDLLAVNWKTAQFSFGNGGSAENPWLHEAAQMDPFLHKVCINRATGEKRGLKDGDLVNIESFESGVTIQGPVKLTEAIHPEVIGIAGLFGHRSPTINPVALKGIHFNSLMADGPGDIDPVSGAFDGSHKVKVTKA